MRKPLFLKGFIAFSRVGENRPVSLSKPALSIAQPPLRSGELLSVEPAGPGVQMLRTPGQVDIYIWAGRGLFHASRHESSCLGYAPTGGKTDTKYMPRNSRELSVLGPAISEMIEIFDVPRIFPRVGLGYARTCRLFARRARQRPARLICRTPSQSDGSSLPRPM